MSDETGYEYDRGNVVESVEDLAEVRLSGAFTLELTAWDNGGFQVEAYHTIDSTYPWEAEARDEEHGLPFYRERLAFSTTGDSEGWFRQEVVRSFCGKTREEVVHSERFGGYTPNWPAPIEDDDEEDDDRPVYPGSTFPGRFA